MRLRLKKKTTKRVNDRKKRKVRIRKKVEGTEERPRLVVFKSLSHIYAQVVDDVAGKTLVSFSSLKLDKKSKKDLAKEVGETVAKKAVEKNIKNVVFDRGGFLYHGRIKALADAAREGGLNF